MQVIDLRERDVRLAQGSLTARGPCSVVTPHGVLEIESGDARVVVDGERYDLSVASGEVSWTGPTQSLTLGAGQHLTSD